MKDTDWKLIYELDKYRNITKAADVLFMTQPSLTRRLQVIEQELGVQIVNRSKHGIEFTRVGNYLVECAARQVEFSEELEGKLSFFRNDQQGTIVIGTSYSFSRTQLPEILGKYRLSHPDIDYELICIRSDKLVQQMNMGRLHVCFVRGNDKSLCREKIMQYATACVISKNPVELSELPNLSRIAYETGKSSREVMEKWWYSHYQVPPRMGMHVTFLDNAYEMVEHGMGYLIGFLSDEEIEKSKLYCYPLKDENGEIIRRVTRFLYQDTKDQPDYVREFVRQVLE